MYDKHIQADALLAVRYGVAGARSRWLHPKFLISVLAVAFLALVTLIGIRYASPDVTGREVNWRAVSATELIVNIDVKMAAGSVAQCAIQALDFNQTQVGYALVQVGPATSDQITQSVTVKTQRIATAGQVASCKLLTSP
ncbi:DUF4307 domain-containing protein [Micrococcales bacterium 31B]|nr:DUF4307 domain-containing protein [Micrococcales bacterium 31B]